MPYTLLIVDDEPLIRNSLSEVLKKEGYELFAVSSAEEAIEAVQKKSVDIVITDLNLPELTGIELLKKIKALKPNIEVIIMTGFGTIETAVEAIKLKAYDYLTKPINDSEIKLMLKRIIEKNEIVRENSTLKNIINKPRVKVLLA